MRYFGINGDEITYLGEFDAPYEVSDDYGDYGDMYGEILTEDELKTLRYNIDKALDTNFDAPVEGQELVVIDENTVLWKDETYVVEPTVRSCKGCVFDEVDSVEFCEQVKCCPFERTDKQNVIFVKKERP